MPTGLVVFVMVIQAQLLAHLDALNDAHPRTIKVAASGRSLSRLQDQKERLECA